MRTVYRMLALILLSVGGIAGSSCVPDALAPAGEIPVAEILVNPSSASVQRGSSMQLTAVVLDSLGNRLADQAVSWSSETPQLVSVSETGVVTALALGATSIRADKKGKRGQARITVTDSTSTAPNPVASVSVSPSSASVEVGKTQQLTATLKDASGNTLTGRSVSWATSSASVATVSSNGLVTGVGAGTAAITATSEGKSGQASIQVTAAPAPPPPPPSPNGLAVIPGAEGYGMTTPAGRGGKIIKVTNLNDDGTGSLRAALTASGPRVVVFEVGGTIELTSNISVNNPYVTVAGQTAPSPGITLAGGGIKIYTNDVLVQHLRIRIGDRPGGPSGGDRDAFSAGAGADRVVIDHVSASWGVDENMSVSASSSSSIIPKNITFRHCIISEALLNSIHPEGAHSKGSLIRRSENISLIGNLFAHNYDRNPEVKGLAQLLFVNNVVYNPGYKTVYFSDSDIVGPILSSVVGNVIIPGPSTVGDWDPIWLRYNLQPGTKIYLSDNWAPGVTSDPWSIAAIDKLSFDPKAATTPMTLSPLTIRPSSATEEWVLANAGARPKNRDPVDVRVVNEVRTRTGRIIDSQNDVGGFPVLSPTYRALTPPANPNGDDDGDGYTNLEEWLHAFLAEVQ